MSEESKEWSRQRKIEAQELAKYCYTISIFDGASVHITAEQKKKLSPLLATSDIKFIEVADAIINKSAIQCIRPREYGGGHEKPLLREYNLMPDCVKEARKLIQ